MQRMTLAAAMAALLLNAAWALKGIVPTGDVGVTEVVDLGKDPRIDGDDVPQGNIPVDPTRSDVEVQILEVFDLASQSGVVSEDLLVTTVEGEGEIRTFGVGDGQEDLSILALSAGPAEPAANQRNLEFAATGIPSLRSLLDGDTLNGEHRDQQRLQRERETTTPKKFGILSLFRRSSKTASTVRPVSQTDKARAQAQAKIDRLRDEALRSGDRAKFAEADRLEQALTNSAVQPISTKLRSVKKW